MEEVYTGNHWSNLISENIVKERSPDSFVVATGITPSGPIHLGNMREVLTGDAIHRSLLNLGKKSKLIYIADTYDPLRTVYPFLPDDFQQFIGMPLYLIPDPEGNCHENYAEHFLSPFLKALEELGIHPEVIRAHELYESGKFNEVIKEAANSLDELKKILENISGRKLEKDWFPFHIKCPSCNKITNTIPQHHDSEKSLISFSCSCGYSSNSSQPFPPAGKLPWRIDWPARWKALGVNVEPFGKDHGAAGGSYDTAKEISEKIYNYPAPYPVIYEWIYLKGRGAMASSTGVGVSIENLLKTVKPEIVRYFVLRSKPEKHIDFDPANGLLQLVDEYNQLEDKYFSDDRDRWTQTLYELCQIEQAPKKPHPHIPLGHLAIAIQAGRKDKNSVIEILKRSGYEIPDQEISFISDLIDRTIYWLDNFAPDGYKFCDPESIEPDISQFSEEQIAILSKLLDKLKDTEWKAESIHLVIHDMTKELNKSPKTVFQAVYLAMINQRSGPKAGWFISSLSKDFVLSRLEKITKR